MSYTGFPVNDLLRRKFQTGLTIATLTLSVASTLFLLLFSSRLGSGLTSTADVFTLGLSAIFSQFILFIGALIFIIGAVLTSFISFLMMAQRTRDFGLMKAAGCPNSLVGGYFMTELLITSFIGCTLGIVFGFLMDYVASNLIFSSYQLPSFWFAPIVFVVFLVLAFVFGLRPIIKASKMSSVEALSPVNYYGLRIGTKHKALSRHSLTWRIASRNLIRRQSATIRIVILLSLVFVLLTISVAGGIIAKDTTTSWVQKTVNSDMIGIAHNSMGYQYKLLLEKFTGAKETAVFNYSDPNLAINNTIIEKLKALPSVGLVDSRLIMKEHVKEVANFTIDPYTLATLPVGDGRQGDVIVVGVDPQNLVSEWSIKGRFLGGNSNLEAVIGDSISQTMYASKYSLLADPLVEGMEIQNTTFNIVGVCVDPLNNGLVTYVPIDKLENITGISSPNLLLIKLNNSLDRNTTMKEIRDIVKGSDPSLDIFDLGGVVKQNTAFLASSWQTIMLLPLFTLASAALCLVGYIMIAVNEQHQEFAVLRAVGAKQKIVIFILAIQSLIVLLSSLGVGISLGTVVTLLILMKQPLVSSGTILEITGWLGAAVVGMFVLSLYPALRIAKAAILKIMT
jgi:ABC-type antimicrobial peptide transport system permease subunit